MKIGLDIANLQNSLEKTFYSPLFLLYLCVFELLPTLRFPYLRPREPYKI